MQCHRNRCWYGGVISIYDKQRTGRPSKSAADDSVLYACLYQRGETHEAGMSRELDISLGNVHSIGPRHTELQKNVCH